MDLAMSKDMAKTVTTLLIFKLLFMTFMQWFQKCDAFKKGSGERALQQLQYNSR